MLMKRGVDASGVDPYLWYWLGRIEELHREWTGSELTVTSLRRPPSSQKSFHSPPKGVLVLAADLRRRRLDSVKKAEAFCRELQRRHGAILDVVLEPEWLTAAQIAARGGLKNIGPHIHVETPVAVFETVD